MEVHHNFALDAMLGQNKDIAPDLGLEIHAISSTSKPLSGWIARDGIQESREACAGHGYLKGKIQRSGLNWCRIYIQIITRHI